VTPRIVEGVIVDTAPGERLEVPTNQLFVATRTQRGWQTLADQICHIGGANAPGGELEVDHLELVALSDK
jgi:hypothetical protein